MKRTTTYEFTEEEEKTLEKALALYAGYTKEMEAGMLVGDESDAGKVTANHNRAMSMHKQLFEIVHETDYEKEREIFAGIRGRPMDINDFSPFDWHKYMQGELNR